MMASLEDQYVFISKEIEDENQSETDFLISSFAAAITNNSSNTNDDSKKERDHLENLTALLCLRIAVVIQLINNGRAELQCQLEEDINTVLEKICSIEYERKVNDEIIDDFTDLIMAISPENRNIIKSVLRNRYKHSLRRKSRLNCILCLFRLLLRFKD